MAQPTLTGFLIGLILISMFAGLFSLFLFTGAEEFGVANTSGVSLENYQHLNELQAQATQLKNDSINVKQQQNVFDLVGGFFSNAYNVILSIPESIGIFDQMVNQAMIDSNIDSTGGQLIKNTIQTILVILIFLGILITALLKWVI